ncbi:hypothetical protein [Aeromicrobium chenweiae]|uniref:Uncharacterized protein n=1 Tax=Aeromicrobium chenweiae TaxID=2079793 RepID=A0A2S0WLZ5_9ACTN|nr:hypothetical protein [Aeromicrobium chenweiae]AWB92363.1 hypothetical protein C3E78_09205 [Aeromicrobium chenweiae]TGN31349.1 hypothetical protein E4L97_13365 [Aeromicrobium chenweiae]
MTSASLGSADRAPWPEEWGTEGTPGRVWRLIVLGLLFEALVVVATVATFFSSDRVLVVPFALGGIAFGAFLWVGWTTQARVHARGSAGISWDADRGALVVDDQRLVTIVYLAATGVLALFAFLAVIVSGWSALDDGGSDATVTFVLCLALLAGLVIGGAQMWRRGTPWLRVSPEGLSHKAGGKETELAWRDMYGIMLTNVTGKDYSITATGPSISKDVTIVGQTLAADPALVAQLIEFYWSHEDARAELTTEASLRRIQSGNFAPQR